MESCYVTNANSKLKNKDDKIRKDYDFNCFKMKNYSCDRKFFHDL